MVQCLRGQQTMCNKNYSYHSYQSSESWCKDKDEADELKIINQRCSVAKGLFVYLYGSMSQDLNTDKNLFGVVLYKYLTLSLWICCTKVQQCQQKYSVVKSKDSE
jgi:L-2-hydroxyglutarate oxidase LhgO